MTDERKAPQWTANHLFERYEAVCTECGYPLIATQIGERVPCLKCHRTYTVVVEEDELT